MPSSGTTSSSELGITSLGQLAAPSSTPVASATESSRVAAVRRLYNAAKEASNIEKVAVYVQMLKKAKALQAEMDKDEDMDIEICRRLEQEYKDLEKAAKNSFPTDF